MVFTGSGRDSVAGCCEHDGEHLVSLKCLNLLSSRGAVSYSRRKE